MTRITSTKNSLVKELRALRGRRERERSGLFLAEGRQVVIAALAHGAPVEALVVAPELLGGWAPPGGAPLVEVSAEVFESIAARERPQGVLAVVRQRWLPLAQLDPLAGRHTVVLEGVQYPGNLGTILRTADATAAAAVVLVGSTADPHDPAAVRASTTAIVTQPVVRADHAELAAWLRRHAVRMVGASPSGRADFRDASYAPPVALAFGGEGPGLSARMRAMCETLAHIPMVGRSDSLNLAIAAGLVLYESLRQQEAG